MVVLLSIEANIFAFTDQRPKGPTTCATYDLWSRTHDSSLVVRPNYHRFIRIWTLTSKRTRFGWPMDLSMPYHHCSICRVSPCPLYEKDRLTNIKR